LGVLGAQHTAMALEDLREDLAGLLPFALIGERRGEIVRGGQGVLVRLAEIPAVDPETTAEERFGLRILTLEPLEAAEGEEASAGISLIAAGWWADAALERWIRTSRRGAAISGWRTTGMDREAGSGHGVSEDRRNLGGIPFALGYLGHAARETVAELTALSKERDVPPCDRALAWLKRAFDDRSLEMIFLKVDPRFDPLHNDPRLVDLLRAIGL
jgi:hypothetical protein